MESYHSKPLSEKWTKWTRHADRSSHWTIDLSQYNFWLLLLAGTLIHLFLAATLPPAEDELYYWSWAQKLGFSYFDHPPMVAYWIRFSTFLFGNSILALRLPAVIGTSFTLYLLANLTEGSTLLTAVIFTPIVFFGGILITPDIPLLVFWTLYVLWLVRVNTIFQPWGDDPVSRVYRRQPVSYWLWGVGGLCLGLGMMSKYTMVLAIPCSFLCLRSKYRWNAWLKGYSFHLFIAGLVSLPILFFNIEYHFSPLKFQWEHAMGGHGFSFLRFLGFWGVQAILLGFIPALLFPWALVKNLEFREKPALHVCFFFFVFPAFFLLFQTLKGSVEANWTLPVYLTLWPLGQTLLDTSSFRYAKKAIVAFSFALPWTLCLIATIHFIHPLPFLPPHQDRFYRLKAKFQFSEMLADALKQITKDTIYVPSYQWTSYFRYRHLKAMQLPGTRESQFSLGAPEFCKLPEAYILFEKGSYLPVINCFQNQKVILERTLFVRGVPFETFQFMHLDHKATR